jgi:hypothetical protein
LPETEVPKVTAEEFVNQPEKEAFVQSQMTTESLKKLVAQNNQLELGEFVIGATGSLRKLFTPSKHEVLDRRFWFRKVGKNINENQKEQKLI